MVTGFSRPMRNAFIALVIALTACTTAPDAPTEVATATGAATTTPTTTATTTPTRTAAPTKHTVTETPEPTHTETATDARWVVCAFEDNVRIRNYPSTATGEVTGEADTGTCYEVLPAMLGQGDGLVYNEGRWWYRLLHGGYTAAEFYVHDGNEWLLTRVPPLVLDIETPTPEAGL